MDDNGMADEWLSRYWRFRYAKYVGIYSKVEVNNKQSVVHIHA